MACWFLVPQPGIEPMLPAVEGAASLTIELLENSLTSILFDLEYIKPNQIRLLIIHHTSVFVKYDAKAQMLF